MSVVHKLHCADCNGSCCRGWKADESLQRKPQLSRYWTKTTCRKCRTGGRYLSGTVTYPRADAGREAW